MKNHYLLIIFWFLVSLWGAFMSFSATYVNDIISGSNPIKGLIINLLMIVAIFIACVFVFIRPKRNFYPQLKKLAIPLFYASIAALILVLVIGDAAVVNNARMIIPLGPFNFQPLEMFKITVILYYAVCLAEMGPNDSFFQLVKISILPVFGTLLLLVQPDMGGAIIIVLVVFLTCFFSGLFTKTLVKIVVTVPLIGAFFIKFVLQGYQLDRITNWINPFNDAKVGGYQLIQSYIAISNGGLSGLGYMNSIQKAGFLTQPGTDFIFAIILEETGIIGAVITIALLMIVPIFLIRIGTQAHERFGMLYCYGMAVLILVQTFINMGGVVGLIPMTGVTLPFISNGINSYLFMTAGVFLAIPISRQGIKEKRRERQLKERP